MAALVERPRHITADELTAVVQASHPDVHQSTVYRCLDSLAELGVIHHSHLGHSPAVYHLADEPHQHLVCEHCGSVLEVPNQVLEPLAARLARDYGFAINPAHFAVVGVCAECA